MAALSAGDSNRKMRPGLALEALHIDRTPLNNLLHTRREAAVPYLSTSWTAEWGKSCIERQESDGRT
jgi:hypothetical protein